MLFFPSRKHIIQHAYKNDNTHTLTQQNNYNTSMQRNCYIHKSITKIHTCKDKSYFKVVEVKMSKHSTSEWLYNRKKKCQAKELTSRWLSKELSSSSHIFQTELVVQVECVEAESNVGALHKVNGIESHFPEVANVKHGNVIIFSKAQTKPNSSML